MHYMPNISAFVALIQYIQSHNILRKDNCNNFHCVTVAIVLPQSILWIDITKHVVCNTLTIQLEFYIHGSVHRDSILIRSNEMQQNAGVYLLQNYSTCLGCLSHPSSGVHETVTAASGTGHSVRATTFRQRGIIRPRWRNIQDVTGGMDQTSGECSLGQTILI